MKPLEQVKHLARTLAPSPHQVVRAEALRRGADVPVAEQPQVLATATPRRRDWPYLHRLLGRRPTPEERTAFVDTYREQISIYTRACPPWGPGASFHEAPEGGADDTLSLPA